MGSCTECHHSDEPSSAAIYVSPTDYQCNVDVVVGGVPGHGYLFEPCRCIHTDYDLVEQKAAEEKVIRDSRLLIEEQEAAVLASNSSDPLYCEAHGGVAIRRCVEDGVKLCASRQCGVQGDDDAWRCSSCDQYRTRRIEERDRRRRQKAERAYQALPPPPPEELKRGLLGYRMMHDGTSYRTTNLIGADYAAAVALLHGPGQIVWRRWWYEGLRLYDPSGYVAEYKEDRDECGDQIKGLEEIVDRGDLANIADGETRTNRVKRKVREAEAEADKAAEEQRRYDAVMRKNARDRARRRVRFAVVTAACIVAGAVTGAAVLDNLIGLISGMIVGLLVSLVVALTRRSRSRKFVMAHRVESEWTEHFRNGYDRW